MSCCGDDQCGWSFSAPARSGKTPLGARPACCSPSARVEDASRRSQLAKQRQAYEGAAAAAPRADAPADAASGAAAARAALDAVRRERRAVDARCRQAARAADAAEAELAFVADLNATLEADAGKWAAEEAAAAADLAKARADADRLASMLEAKLAAAMEQLDVSTTDVPPPAPG